MIVRDTAHAPGGAALWRAGAHTRTIQSAAFSAPAVCSARPRPEGA